MTAADTSKLFVTEHQIKDAGKFGQFFGEVLAPMKNVSVFDAMNHPKFGGNHCLLTDTEAAVVMKDLVRKYPEQFERASGAVERCIKIVTEPEGKCALLWILGEYGLLIEDAPYLLEPMIDGFLEETSGSVRLEMLTAAVKLFFCRPPEMQNMLGSLLQKAICETTHPDVRDRAILYYRLLEHSPEEARRVICAP